MNVAARVVRFVVVRNRTALVAALVVVFASSGTAIAVSMVLGGTNTTTKVTTVKSNVNGAVLAITNTNAGGGVNAKGVAITVPAGRAPITVNANAGKATNLNADKLDGLEAAAFLPAGGTAVDADKLDGQDSSAFLAADGTAVNAEKLDGIDSSDVVRGTSRISSYAFAVPPGNFWIMFQLGLDLAYACPTNLANDGFVQIENSTFETLNAFADSGGAAAQYASLGSHGTLGVNMSPAGDHVTFQVQGSFIATVEAFAVNRATDCHFQVQVVFDHR